MQFVTTQPHLLEIEASAQDLADPLRAWRARLALAWHLRQRDPQRALAWVAQIRRLTPEQHAALGWSPRAVQARLQLIEAEQALLEARLPQGLAWADAASAALAQEGDAQGLADAALLHATHATLTGQSEAAAQACWRAASHAAQAGDAMRERIARARAALCITFRDPMAGRRDFAAEYAQVAMLHPGSDAWAHEMQGTLAAQASDYGLAAVARMHTFDEALQTGQIDRAIVAAQNAADALNSLNEHETALEWLDKAAQLVRPTGWPLINGLVMAQLAETLRRLGQLDEALDAVREVLPTLTHLRGSRIFCIVMRSLAEVHRGRAEWPQALAAFEELEAESRRHGHPDLLVYACRGQAQVLQQQGQASRAEIKARQGLQVALDSQHVYRQIDCLQALADLHAQSELPPPPELNADSAELHYLEQAQALARTIDGFRMPAELLERLADAQARQGRHAQAYALAKDALHARQTLQSETVQKRLAAMRVMHQTEWARAEAEHMRLLAQEQSQRAEAMGQSRDTLLQLSELGRTLTSLLDRQAILSTLAVDMHALLRFRHLHLVLPVPAEAVEGDETVPAWQCWQLQPDGQVNAGPLPGPGAPLAWLAQAGQQSLDAEFSPGPQGVALRLPLGSGRRLVGALLGELADLPGEREHLVLRNLAAYAAIALENAQAHQHLHDTQAQLVQREKLAALGSLVAGVAHELNTPLGNCLMTASSLQHQSRWLREQLDAQTLRRSALQEFASRTESATELLLRGLTRASDLVQRFKQIAGEPLRGTVQRCDVGALLAHCVQAQAEAARAAGAQVQLQVPPDLTLATHPAHLQQVIEQLLQNALLHGAAGRTGARVWVQARPWSDGGLCLTVSDDGPGVPPELQGRVFDPFFSTRFGQGGSGLGLYIAHNLVQGALQGSLRLLSEPGQGACFELLLPSLSAQPAA